MIIGFNTTTYMERTGQDSGNIRAYEISDSLPEGFSSTGEVDKLAEYFLNAAPESFKNGVEAAATGVP
ncbi:hypothetical protein LguiA_020043 [Lonicera macranthoides]